MRATVACRATLRPTPRRAVAGRGASRPMAAARPDAAPSPAAALAALSTLLAAAPAFADDAPAAAPGVNPFEIGLALSPALFYGVLTLVRQVNPKVKISDLLFALAGLVIVANIISILVFKKRIY